MTTTITYQMADEFLESDVVFSDNNQNTHHPRFAEVDSCFNRQPEVVVAPPQKNSPAVRCGKSMVASGSCNKKTVASSLPVNIPQGMVRSLDSDEDEEEEEEEEMVPPHVIMGRRVAGKMAFSVCTGQGRTLKGRDLSQVRNSILRMTGFLET